MPLLRNLLIAIATTAAQADVRGFLQANNAFERVWMVCEQPKSKAPSAGEKAAGMLDVFLMETLYLHFFRIDFG